MDGYYEFGKEERRKEKVQELLGKLKKAQKKSVFDEEGYRIEEGASVAEAFEAVFECIEFILKETQ